MIKVLIVENETEPAEILKSHLYKLFPEMEILEVCETVDTSLIAIKKLLPDLVFLDIELNNNENGFEILKKLGEINFDIIITTSYDKYALQACKASIIDFLLKPFSIDELIEAVEKYRKKIRRAINPKQIELLLSIYRNSTLSLTNFALPTRWGLTFVETNDIIYFEGDDNQSIVHLLSGTKQHINRLLKECEKLLSDSNFCRIHKSYLINLNHVKKYYKGKDGYVLMSNRETLTVSRDYKDEFLRLSRGR